MREVTRYSRDPIGGMSDESDGEYVLWDNYDHLTAELEQVKAELEQARNHIDAYAKAHDDACEREVDATEKLDRTMVPAGCTRAISTTRSSYPNY